ncbi:unnamed protein product [Schistosoma mattheei]|uniref:Mitochondrial import inner membrane translocase subunit Tim21 n=1 Tax=Schistosoma mattheei TaxID=31246 RepID=A0AA85AXN8_9TREM|nr:unnamed protein product [Schistosoma mattheei]
MTRFVKLICFQVPSVKLSVSRFPYQQWPVRPYRSVSSASNSSVTPSEKRENLPLASVTEKVKQTTKDVGYFTVVLGGFVLTGTILYAIIHELFSSRSPNGVYDDAFRICKTDSRVRLLCLIVLEVLSRLVPAPIVVVEDKILPMTHGMMTKVDCIWQ